MFNQLGVIGCGLMGGSFALALKRAELVKRVVGYSKSPSTTDKAKHLGVLDVAVESALQAVSGSDIVLIAVPVSASEDTFRAIYPLVEPHVLIMDVGSTKADVVEAARRALKERVRSFVAAHPIAGREVSGVSNSDPLLYVNRRVILTPIPENPPELVQKAASVWNAIGSQVSEMNAQAHDAALAGVSHLPHLLAFAYLNGITQQADGEKLLSLAGPGFRDFTRIAASDPAMWRDILLSNQTELANQLQQFRQALDLIEDKMKAGDSASLEALIRGASKARAVWQLDPGTTSIAPTSSSPRPTVKRRS
jgi:prephenate dehydrogenase